MCAFYCFKIVQLTKVNRENLHYYLYTVIIITQCHFSLTNNWLRRPYGMKIMDLMETSLIITGRGAFIRSSFDKPISVKGKLIGIKSINFPAARSRPVHYHFTVRDSKGTLHTLTLPPYLWIWSNDLLKAMYIELNELYESLAASNQQTYIIDQGSEDVEIIDHNKPRISRQSNSIFYNGSGLKIVPDNLPHKSVFSLLKESSNHSDHRKFSYTNHLLETPELENFVVSKEGTKEPVYVYCDAIKPTYINNVKRRVLDVVTMAWGGTESSFYSDLKTQFHEFAVDELSQIEFYFKAPDEYIPIFFDDLVVIHLTIK